MRYVRGNAQNQYSVRQDAPKRNAGVTGKFEWAKTEGGKNIRRKPGYDWEILDPFQDKWIIFQG